MTSALRDSDPILEWLTIHKHPLVAQPTTLNFASGNNLVLGRNGSGKTTLLKLIAMAVGHDFRQLTSVRDDVELEYCVAREVDGTANGLPSGEYGLTVRIAVQPSRTARPEGVHQEGASAGLQGASGLSELPWRVDGRLEYRGDEAGEFEKGDTVISFQGGPRSWKSEPELDLDEGFMGPPNPLRHGDVIVGVGIQAMLATLPVPRSTSGAEHSAYERAFKAKQALLVFSTSKNGGSPGRFDESLDFYDKVFGPEAEAGLRIGDKSSPSSVELVSFELLRRENVHEFSWTAGWTHEDFKTLRTFVDLCGARASSLRPRFVEREANGRTKYRGFDLTIEWPNGSAHSHDQLSFGEKRLLAFLWYLSVAGRSPAVLDELANGLHADWVHACIDALDGKQAFHAAQNPLIVDALGVRDLPSALANVVFCSREDEGWIWRNPTDDEAERVRRALDAGLQQLSEVLYTSGLW